jgi:hypothetical protein
MKKIIVAVLGLAMMSSSVAFADSVTHSKLSAFQNVKTTSVSTEEMNKVSGELAPVALIGAGLIGRYLANKAANKVTCGAWTCKVR